MRFRTLDENWDWNFGRGMQDYAYDSLGVSYNLKTTILSWINDCFFDLPAGISWKKYLGGKGNKQEIDKSIKDKIISSGEVSEITYFDSSVNNRNYTCTARVKTIYGDTIEVRI